MLRALSVSSPWPLGRSRTAAMMMIAATILAQGCRPAADDEHIGVVEGPVTSPSQNDVPPWVVRLVITGRKPGSDPTSPLRLEGCSGSVIAHRPYATWVLTAAHCFEGIDPKLTLVIPKFVETTVTVSTNTGASLGVVKPKQQPFRVQFHPSAFKGLKLTGWTQAIPSALPAHDVALVRLDTASAQPVPTPIKLWAPLDDAAAAQALQGAAVAIAGYDGTIVNGDIIPKPATGNETIVGIDGVGRLVGNGSPSHDEPGDSGGPVFRALSNNLPPSVSALLSTCADKPGQAGDEVLVGIIEAQNPDSFLPAFRHDIVEWAAKTAQADFDGDELCDDQDNCVKAKVGLPGRLRLLGEYQGLDDAREE